MLKKHKGFTACLLMSILLIASCSLFNTGSKRSRTTGTQSLDGGSSYNSNNVNNNNDYSNVCTGDNWYNNGQCMSCPVNSSVDETHTSCECISGNFDPATNQCTIAGPNAITVSGGATSCELNEIVSVPFVAKSASGAVLSGINWATASGTGSIDSSGVLTCPSSIGSASTANIVVMASKNGYTQGSKIVIVNNSDNRINISGGAIAGLAGQTIFPAFEAKDSYGNVINGVTWITSNGASINSYGELTCPSQAILSTLNSKLITVIATKNGYIADLKTVKCTNASALNITGPDYCIPGQPLPSTVTAVNSAGAIVTGVTWSAIKGGTGGILPNTGTAPTFQCTCPAVTENAASITVSKSGYESDAKIIPVTDATHIVIIGASACIPGYTVPTPFQAIANGVPVTGVTWSASTSSSSANITSSGLLTCPSNAAQVSVQALKNGMVSGYKMVQISGHVAGTDLPAITIGDGAGSCTAGATISNPFKAYGLIVSGNAGTQGVLTGVSWTSSVAGSINSSTGVVTCPSITGSFTITASKAGYADGTKSIPVNSANFSLTQTSTSISAAKDCIGGGNGGNGITYVTFKAFYNGTDVTSSTTWIGDGSAVPDASVKGRFNCTGTTNAVQMQTNTIKAVYSGSTTTENIIVEDCGAYDQNNCM